MHHNTYIHIYTYILYIHTWKAFKFYYEVRLPTDDAPEEDHAGILLHNNCNGLANVATLSRGKVHTYIAILILVIVIVIFIIVVIFI